MPDRLVQELWAVRHFNKQMEGVVNVVWDVLICFDTSVCVVVGVALAAGYRAMLPHIKEFKQFTQMMGMGKK